MHHKSTLEEVIFNFRSLAIYTERVKTDIWSFLKLTKKRKKMMAKKLYLLRLSNVAPFRMLQLEEALMRGDDRNWCITNRGSLPAHVVLGTGGKPRKLLDVERCERDGIPLIKRFSGGGTVVVDDGTLFVSFVGNSGEMAAVESAPKQSDAKESPRDVMEWSGRLFTSVFSALGINDFALTEHDYVFRGSADASGDASSDSSAPTSAAASADTTLAMLSQQRKCAGNAQAFARRRWVHHTSFLWRFEAARMAYLSLPEKRPDYRADRPHSDFLCSLESRGVASPEAFYDSLERELRAAYDVVDVDEANFETIYAAADERNERENHGRRTTRWVDAEGAKIEEPPH